MKLRRIRRCDPWTGDCATCKDFRKCHNQDSLNRKLSPHLEFPRLPHTLLPHLSQLSGPALKVFLFLNSAADFRETSNRYGRVALTYEELKRYSGASKRHMYEYTKELEAKGLIKQHRRGIETAHGLKTYKQYTVNWLIRNLELKKLLDKGGPSDDEVENPVLKRKLRTAFESRSKSKAKPS